MELREVPRRTRRGHHRPLPAPHRAPRRRAGDGHRGPPALSGPDRASPGGAGQPSPSAVVVEVDDPADPRLAAYRHLTDAALRRHLEAEQGLFVAEGTLVLRQAVAAGWRLHSLLLLPGPAQRLVEVVAAAARDGAPVYVAPPAVLQAVTGFPVHRGVLGLAERRPEPELDALLSAADTVVVAEGLTDHQNVGALFRNAASFGVGAVLLDPSCADPLYRRAVRVSTGHVLRVPFARLSPWPDRLAEVAAAGFAVVALTPGAGLTIDEVAADLAARPGPARLALLVGAEGPGLRVGTLAAAGWRARIPMAPGVDSLNVATAAAVALHCFAAARRVGS